MSQSQFSLYWEAHRKNVCSGLSTLQQNGEFVDMTLAADGHFVKVHQVIMALASPYIKDLITAAHTSASHPIIFLNKTSYTTLSALLEYIYTGETVITIENLQEFSEAAKELHIKGLEDMKFYDSVASKLDSDVYCEQIREEDCTMEVLGDDSCYDELETGENNKSRVAEENTSYMDVKEDLQMNEISVEHDYDQQQIHGADETDQYQNVIPVKTMSASNQNKPNLRNSVSVMQYTVSCQGSLQMILNRFVYYLKHTNKNNSRQWRCVDYLSSIKCPAYVVTHDGVVILRTSAHTHPFHDKRILKKVKVGAIFSALHEAELERDAKRAEKDEKK